MRGEACVASEVCVGLEVTLVLSLPFLLEQLLATESGEASGLASVVGAPGLMYSVLCLHFFPKWHPV